MSTTSMYSLLAAGNTYDDLQVWAIVVFAVVVTIGNILKKLKERQSPGGAAPPPPAERSASEPQGPAAESPVARDQARVDLPRPPAPLPRPMPAPPRREVPIGPSGPVARPLPGAPRRIEPVRRVPIPISPAESTPALRRAVEGVRRATPRPTVPPAVGLGLVGRLGAALPLAPAVDGAMQARTRVQALLQEQAGLQVAFVLSELFGPPVAMRDDHLLR